MELFLTNKSGTINAKALFSENDGKLTVCKGSIISSRVSGGTFRSAGTVEKIRSDEKLVKGVKVVNDIAFKSASAASNFVTGCSTNGLMAWKDKDGLPLKKLIER